MNVADLLDAAADRLLIYGWQRGSAGTSAGPNCLLGAVFWTSWEEGDSWEAFVLRWEAGQLLASHIGGSTTIPDWNDDPHRTEDDVHDALRNTAKLWREQDGQRD